MKIDTLRLAQVKPNAYNPNRMDPDKAKALAKVIGKFGYLQPIVVRPTKQEFPGDPEAEYEIVDGEHRFDVLTAKGETHAEFVIAEDLGDWDAKLATLAFRLKGRHVPMAEAELLVDLKAEMGAAALADIGYTTDDLAKADELAGPLDSEDLSQDPDDLAGPKDDPGPRSFSVTGLDSEQYGEIMRAMRSAKVQAETDSDAIALSMMAGEFLATYPVED